MRVGKIIMIALGIIIAVTLFIYLAYHSNKRPPAIISNKTHSVIAKPEQQEILSDIEIDSVLNSLTKIPFGNIEQDYLNFSGYNNTSFRIKMKDRIFYRLSDDDLAKKLVGKFTIADFMPKDNRLRTLHPEIGSTQYFYMEKYILHRLLDLIMALKKNGYNDDALIISDGYRYPSFNEYTGGVSGSQHLYGRAIDIAIGDINNDGNFNENIDKKIVLSILENEIVRNSGGVGRYVNTNVVHFDTRGEYKRWDSQ